MYTDSMMFLHKLSKFQRNFVSKNEFGFSDGSRETFVNSSPSSDFFGLLGYDRIYWDAKSFITTAYLLSNHQSFLLGVWLR